MEPSLPNPVTESFAKILTNLGLEENKDFDRASMDKVSKMDEYYDLSLYGNTETGEDPDDENDYYYTRERYWYHPNYLGNVDMITNDNGQIHQYFVYSPFGENMYQYNRNSDFNSRYRFNGKEIDPETGNQYYGARYYDPEVSVWLSVDPLAHKYRSLSSYVFVANNPINLVDPDGRDIIILTHGKRPATNGEEHKVGHQAVLVGSDKTGWTYMSYDFDEGVNKGREGSGENNVFTIEHFDCLSDFKNSEHNSFKSDYDDGEGLNTSHRDENGDIIQRYDLAYKITANESTDKLMVDKAMEVFEDPYNVINNNCTDVAQEALDAGGFKNGELKRFPSNIEPTPNFLPLSKIFEIIRANPGGVDFENEIKRTDGTCY